MDFLSDRRVIFLGKYLFRVLIHCKHILQQFNHEHKPRGVIHHLRRIHFLFKVHHIIFKALSNHFGQQFRRHSLDSPQHTQKRHLLRNLQAVQVEPIFLEDGKSLTQFLEEVDVQILFLSWGVISQGLNLIVLASRPPDDTRLYPLGDRALSFIELVDEYCQFLIFFGFLVWEISSDDLDLIDEEFQQVVFFIVQKQLNKLIEQGNLLHLEFHIGDHEEQNSKQVHGLLCNIQRVCQSLHSLPTLNGDLHFRGQVFINYFRHFIPLFL